MKQSQKKSHFIVCMSLVCLYALLNSYGALVLKYEINRIPEALASEPLFFFLSLAQSMPALSGLAAIFLSAFIWMAVLSKWDISVAYPIATGLNFLIVIGISISILREQLSWNQEIGRAHV